MDKKLVTENYEINSDEVTVKICDFIERYKLSLDPDAIKQFHDHLNTRIKSLENITSGIFGKIRWIYYCIFRNDWNKIQTQKKLLDETSKKVESAWEERTKKSEISEGGPKTPNKPENSNTFSSAFTTPKKPPASINPKTPVKNFSTPAKHSPNHFSKLNSTNFAPPPPPQEDQKIERPKELMLPEEPKRPVLSSDYKKLELEELEKEINQIKQYVNKLQEILEKLTTDYKKIEKLSNTIPVINTYIIELVYKEEQCEKIISYLDLSIKKEIDCELELTSEETIISLPFTNKKIPIQEIPKECNEQIKKFLGVFNLDDTLNNYKENLKNIKTAIENEKKSKEKAENDLKELLNISCSTYSIEGSNNKEKIKKLFDLNKSKTDLKGTWIRNKNYREKHYEILKEHTERTKVSKDIHQSTPKKNKKSKSLSTNSPISTPTSDNNFLTSSLKDSSFSGFLIKLNKCFNQFKQNHYIQLNVVKKLENQKEEMKDIEIFEIFTQSIYSYLHVPNNFVFPKKEETK